MEISNLRVLRPPFPKDLLVELTNDCNHRCIFCANRKMTRHRQHIDVDLFYHILQQAYDCGVRNLGLYTTGEAFLSSGLDKHIRKAKQIGYSYIFLDTNGALATPERSKAVIDAGLDSIKFSINAGTPKTYKRIHGRDDFEQVIGNLHFISEYKKRYKVPLRLLGSYIITRQNQHECDHLKTLLSPYIDDISFLHVGNQGGLTYGIADRLKLAHITLGRKSCDIIFNRLHITCEGYLTICCVDYQNYLVVADLNRMSLPDAWHSAPFIDIRLRHIEQRLEGTLCYNCFYNKQEHLTPLISQYATMI